MRMVFPHNVMSGRLLDDLASEMNTFVETIFGEDAAKAPVNGYSPRMDVTESEKAFELELDLPGVNPSDVNIDIEADHVVIHGKRVQKACADGVDRQRTEQQRTERSFGEFRRTVKLPKMIDTDAIKANFDNGVLSIVMPKLVEQKTSRRVEISYGGNTASDVPVDEA